MKKIVLSLSLLISILVLIQCSKEEPIVEMPVGAPKVSSIQLDDISNLGNGEDLEIRFNKANNESLVSEYRIIVVKKSESASFNLATSENLSAENYTGLSPNGLNRITILSADSKDSSGDLIIENIEYVVYILSIADGVNAVNNALSSSSPPITLSQTKIKITYIGNDGVHITDGEKSVIIDALPGDLSGWRVIANGVQNDIENGRNEFAGIGVAMVTHNHGDHFSPSSVNNFLNRNNAAMFIGPPDVASSITNLDQISAANPASGESESVEIDGINIKVLNMNHFDAFGNDFSSVINFGYIVELGGLKILHLGDFEYSTQNLAPFQLLSENIDVVLLPGLSPFLNQESKTVVDSSINPENIIVLHLLSATTSFDVSNIYPDATIFTSSLQIKRY